MVEFRSFANVPKKQVLSSLATYPASAAMRNIPEKRRSRRQQRSQAIPSLFRLGRF
jgi:hypothetical protein